MCIIVKNIHSTHLFTSQPSVAFDLRPPVHSDDSSPLLVHIKKKTPSNIEGMRVQKHKHAQRKAVAESACGFDWCD